MADRYEYRMTIGDSVTVGNDGQSLRERWSAFVNSNLSGRYDGKLERRYVTDDPEYLDLLTDTRGTLKVGKMIASPWRVIAERKVEPKRIGGIVELVVQ